MLVADCRQSLSTIPVSDLIHHLTGANQQAFLRLRLALGLNLRRQLLIGVCDDLAIRNALAEKLAQDLPCLQDLQSFIAFESAVSGRLSQAKSTEQLLTLTLHPTEPTILGPFFQELRRDPQKPKFGVQILGIEQLTRQPVHIQRAFLNHLRSLGRNFNHIDSNILLWVTRPWWRSIQQAAPEFCRWHNGIFEFEGDPLPVSAAVAQPDITERPRPTPDLIPQPTPQLVAVSVAQTALPIVEAPVKEIPVAPIVPQTPVLPIQPLLPQEPVLPQQEPAIALSDAPLSDTLVAEPIAESLLAKPTASPNHLEPSQEELELADLVLASVMQQVSQNPEIMLQADVPNLDHPTLEPIRILQQVEVLQQQQLDPESFATIYRQLGDYYRNHHDATLSQNAALAMHQLKVGIHAYEVAWKFLPAQHSAIAEIFNDIGNLHWMLSRCPDAADHALEYLQQGIERYQNAIEQLDAQVHPYTCAMLHNNIGAAYGDLALKQDPVENLRKSITAYETALHYRPAEAEPRRYAATQNNLGTAYWNLGQHHNLVQNLRRAVAAYNEALKIYNPDEEPLHYAMIQNNLGTAYWNLAQCDLDSADPEEQLEATSEDFLRLAIGSYRIALIYRTYEAAPNAHAATQNNLGTAYWHLANLPSTHHEDVQGFLHQAIVAYETAIQTAQLITTPLAFDLAATHNNLASAHYQAATNRYAQIDRQTQASYLDLTLQHHLKAMELWDSESELYEAALNGVMQTIRAIHELQGIQGQTQALSKLPASVLGVVMKAL